MDNEKKDIVKKTKEEEMDFYTKVIALLREFGWVLEHPILKELVMAAPSADSLIKHIENQFRDFRQETSLISAMSGAMRLWELIKEKDKLLKEDLAKPLRRSRLANIFTFGDITDLPSRHKNLGPIGSATDIKLLPNSQGIDCSNWPLLLRELCMGKNDDFITGVDDYGKVQLFLKLEGTSERFLKIIRPDSYQDTIRPNEAGYVFSTKTAKQRNYGESGYAQFLFENFGLNTRIAKVDPPKGEVFPRFFKCVSFCEFSSDYPLSVIDILWPIDGFKQNGRLFFSKLTTLEPTDLKIVLNMEFTFDDNFHLIPDSKWVLNTPYKYISVQSVYRKQDLADKSSDFPQNGELGKIVEVLFKDFIKILQYCGNETVSLESIIGEEMLRNPPNCLLDLFTGENKKKS